MLARLPADLLGLFAQHLDAFDFFALRASCRRLRACYGRDLYIRHSSEPVRAGSSVYWRHKTTRLAHGPCRSAAGTTLQTYLHGTLHGVHGHRIYRYGHVVGHVVGPYTVPVSQACIEFMSDPSLAARKHASLHGESWMQSGDGREIDASRLFLDDRYRHAGPILSLDVSLGRGWTGHAEYRPSLDGQGCFYEIRDEKGRLRVRMSISLLGQPCGLYQAWFNNGRLKKVGQYALVPATPCARRPFPTLKDILAKYASKRVGSWQFHGKDGHVRVREFTASEDDVTSEGLSSTFSCGDGASYSKTTKKTKRTSKTKTSSTRTSKTKTSSTRTSKTKTSSTKSRS